MHRPTDIHIGFIPNRLAFCLLLACLSMGISIPAAMAQQPDAKAQTAVTYNIPAGSLDQVLNQFAAKAGILLAVDGSLTAEHRSAGLQGAYATNEGLAAILEGTGLVARYSSTGVVTLVKAGELQADNGPIQLSAIRVGGRVDTARQADEPFRTPGSSAYISQDTIQHFRGTSPGDIFKSTPGVISAQNRNGAAVDVNIRGLQGQNRVKVTIDGTQQSTSTWRGYFGVDNRVYIDPDFISDVSIAKGPSNGASGAGVTGGVVAVSTLKTQDIVKPDESVGVRVRVGTNDNAIAPPDPLTFEQRTDAPTFTDFENYSGSLAVGVVKENYELLAARVKRKNGNYFAGHNGETMYRFEEPTFATEAPLSYTKHGEEVFNTSQDVSSTLLKGTFRWDQAHTLELGYMRYDNTFGEVMPSVVFTQDNSVRQIKLSEAIVDTYTSRYRWTPNSDFWDLHVNLWLTDIDQTTRSVGPGFDFPPYVLADDPRDASVKTYGFDISNSSLFDTTAGDVITNYGISYSLEDTDGKPYLSRTWEDDYPLVLNPSVGSRKISSLFSDMQWMPNEYWTVAASLRYDTYKIKDKSAPGTFPLVGEYPDQDGERLSPTVSISYAPWQSTQFYVQYAEGMRPPSLRESVGNGSGLYPNPNLKPEITRNWEAGVNVLSHDWITSGDTTQLKLSYFNNTHDDYISRVTTEGDSAYVAYYTTENIDKAQFSGVELSGGYDMRVFYTELAVTYYDDVKFCRKGDACSSGNLSEDYAMNHLPPEYTGSLTLGSRLLDEKLQFGARINRVGPRVAPLPFSGYQRGSKWAPYTVVDMFTSYAFNDDVEVQVRVENLTDRYYVDALEGSVPSPGRTISTDLTLRF